MINCNKINFTPIEKNENESINDYHNRAYNIYKKEIVDSILNFKGKKVITREYPIEDGKVQSFFHIISEQNKNGLKIRLYKNERVKFIPYISEIIKNYYKCENCIESCSKIKVWSAPYKNKIYRTKLYLEDEDYIIILEERKEYYLLISAYVVDRLDRKEDLLKEYNKYK